MKVSELKQRLESAKDDDNVMIAIKLPYVTVGAIPMTSVKLAFNGFDWEKGNFILTPEELLTPTDRDFDSQMREMQRVADLVQYENRGLKAEIKKLKKHFGVES